MKVEKKRERARWKVDIELKDDDYPTGIDEPDSIVVLEDSQDRPNTTTTNNSSDATKQVTFDTTEEVIAVPPKKSSRVAWQDDLEFIE